MTIGVEGASDSKCCRELQGWRRFGDSALYVIVEAFFGGGLYLEWYEILASSACRVGSTMA